MKLMDSLIGKLTFLISTTDRPRIAERIPEQSAFEIELNQWVSYGGVRANKKNRQIVAEKIQKAYATQAKTLDLSNCNLTILPVVIGDLRSLEELVLYDNLLNTLPDTIGKLSNLKTLSVGHNHLISLPDTIGRLENLQSLGLYDNKLKTIPITIGSLNKLQNFSLGHNLISSLPHEIGRLTKLLTFGLDHNQLTILPDSIGNLTKLSILGLANNNLTTLPDVFSNLPSLLEIRFNHNPLLSSLPMSLGNCKYLRKLDNMNTKVPDADIIAIEARARIIGTGKEVLRLQDRLGIWLGYAGLKPDFTVFSVVSRFDEPQQMQINEWLFRLESCADFRNRKKELADVVCRILETLNNSPKFRDTFFAQLQNNLEQCEDRIAMLLNIIFIEMVIYTLPQDATTAEKIALLEGAAKTITLRNVLTAMILSYEKTNKVLNENVEIYLYYETKFKEPLKLVTAIDQMNYDQIGNRSDVIDEVELDRSVRANYMDTLIEFPLLNDLLKSDPSFGHLYQSELSVILKNSAAEMTFIEEHRLLNSKEQEYICAVNTLRREREDKLVNLRKKYIEICKCGLMC